jgi:hypothetical protein
MNNFSFMFHHRRAPLLVATGEFWGNPKGVENQKIQNPKFSLVYCHIRCALKRASKQSLNGQNPTFID